MQLDPLLDALSDIPRLAGAKCKGKSAVWESDDLELREYALHQCASCPALAACESFFLSLKPSKRPIGVIAGRVVHEHNKRAAA